MSIYTLTLKYEFTETHSARVHKVFEDKRTVRFQIELPHLPDDLSIIEFPRDDYDGWGLIKAIARRVIKAEARQRIKKQ